MIIPAASNCHTGVVKSAVLTPDGRKCEYTTAGDYNTAPIRYNIAMRPEPENSVEIMLALIGHGACSKIIDVDGKHLLMIRLSRMGHVDR
jgi:hypothetical protein